MADKYEKQIEEMQAKINKLKDRQKKAKKKKTDKLGVAVADFIPKILDKMDEEDFNIFEFVQTKNFTNMLYHQISENERKAQQSETSSEDVGEYNAFSENESY